MTDAPESQPKTAASTLREALRRDLIVAIKTRQTDTVTALRTALAAIDNAEAVNSQGRTKTIASEYIAGASAGVGSTEATRRDLYVDDLHAILREQITERTSAADIYDEHGQTHAADRLRREANVLTKYITIT
jgi:uncharacterized protein YqeY